MLGVKPQQSLIETAALSGNLDMVKSLFAQSESRPEVSFKTIAKLFKEGKSKIGRYVMEHANWHVDHEDEIKSTGYDSVLAFFIQYSKNDNELNDYLEYWVREEFALEQLRKAIKANDIDMFDKTYKHHFGENGVVARLIESAPSWLDNKLTNAIYNEGRRFLRKQGYESLSAQLTPKNRDFGYCALTRLISEVPKDNAPFIAKFIELGYDGAFFGEITIEEWCKTNGCEDLLELEHVKKQVLEDRHFAKIKSCFSESGKSWQPVIAYLDSLPVEKRQESIVNLSMMTPGYVPLWQHAAMKNQVAVLSYPDVLPKEGISSQLHKVIYDAATSVGQEDAVEYLVKHAKLYMPGALRFTQEEINHIRTLNGEKLASLVQNAKCAPVTTMQQQKSLEQEQTAGPSYLTSFFAGLNYFLGPEDDASYEMDASVDDVSEFTFSPNFVEFTGRKGLMSSRGFT
ncbi:MAG: hypothetical protein JSR17_12770 [Proteobacteria bacterium]|nr:hypothetical protein [Pseudomonadota bacterium]